MAETTTTSTTRQCAPGHTTGSKPYIVPVAGNNTRDIPVFVAYHGGDYLDAEGYVDATPHWMAYDQARLAIAWHEGHVSRPFMRKAV